MVKAKEPNVTKGKRRAGQTVGYLRVSALDQKELRQLEGIDLDKQFTDKASGKDMHRPQLQQLMEYVREGDTVVCHAMDRLARNLDDLRKIVLGLTERGVHVRFEKEDPSATPFLAIAPPLILIAALFLTVRGRRFTDQMSLKWSVLIHSVRVLVEINLYVLFLYKQVPALMTFEAGNLDILAGLSAPVIWWAYSKGRVGRRGLLIWNTLALLSVLNAFGRAMLSAPFRFQRFAFHQPTVAILVFPFVLLPAFLVPAVLLCHFAAFYKLTSPREGVKQKAFLNAG